MNSRHSMKLTSLIQHTIGRVWRKASRVKHSIDKYLFSDFSQAGETKAIRKILGVGRPYSGYFVEIGANDGVTLSTTLGLLKDGWSGLSVEPNPVVFSKLEQNWRGYSRVRLACVAVASKPGPVRLWFANNDPGGLMSTISNDDSDWFRAVRSNEYIEVPGLTITNLFESYDVPRFFDMLLIDTEGMDYEILTTLDFQRFSPRLIVTEDYDPTNAQKFALLEDSGYVKKASIGCNTFWMTSEAAG